MAPALLAGEEKSIDIQNATRQELVALLDEEFFIRHAGVT